MKKLKMHIESGWEKWRATTLLSKEPETIAWIGSFSEPEGIFWDIGANVGIYSLYCAYKHPKMTIRAFEPMRGNFLRLWQNIFANNYTNVTAYFVAVGRENGDSHFAGSDAVGSSGGQVGEKGYPVKTVCGDWMSAVPVDCPSYVKIDTDGNEWDILQGMDGTLHCDSLKSVLVEINNNNFRIMEFMNDHGLFYDEKLMALKNRISDNNVIFTRK